MLHWPEQRWILGSSYKSTLTLSPEVRYPIGALFSNAGKRTPDPVSWCVCWHEIEGPYF